MKSATTRRAGTLTLAILALMTVPDTAVGQRQDRVYKDYEVQAAYIYNFLDFVDWPQPRDTITFGILGADPFEDAFEPIEGRRINGRVFLIQRSDDLQNLMACQILFISDSESIRASKILDRLKRLPILTVGTMDEFIPLGGMVYFFPQEANGQTKIRFEISKVHADLAGLKISSRLLSLSRSAGE